MKGMIDETELEQLERLADNYLKCVSLPLEESTYRELAIHFCPALVAEVRRLREKVEEWEWFVEVHSFLLWRGAEKEMWEIFTAAREAVHADRE